MNQNVAAQMDIMMDVETTLSATQTVLITEKAHYPLMKLVDVLMNIQRVMNVLLNVKLVTTLLHVPNVLDSEPDFQNAHAQIIIILMMKVFAKIVIINVRLVPNTKLVTPVELKLTEIKMVSNN